MDSSRKVEIIFRDANNNGRFAKTYDEQPVGLRLRG